MFTFPTTDEEEPDLDYGDLGLETDEPAAKDEIKVEPKHTDLPPPGAGETDWAPIRQSLIDHRLSKGRNADGSKITKARATATDLAIITAPARPASLDEIDRARKALCVAANALGWGVRIIRSEVHVNPVLYVDDSKEDGASEHKAGDVRYEAHDDVQWVIQARHDAGMGFQATYITRDGKTGFVDAIVRDPVGLPTEHRADYSPSRYMKDTMLERAANSLANERDRRYNDGEEYLAHSAYFEKAGELHQWLNDWLDITGSDAKRLSVPTVKSAVEKVEAKTLAMLESGEWNG